MKGQVLILVSVLIVIAFIMLRVTTSVPSEIYQSADFNSYNKIQKEFIEVIDISLINKQTWTNIRGNLDNFALFTRDVMRTKGYTEEVIYSFNHNGSNIVLSNYLGYSLNNVNITLMTPGWSNSKLLNTLNDKSSTLATCSPFSGSYTVIVESNEKNFTYTGQFTTKETFEFSFG